MSNLRDFTGKNRVFTGTDAETITSGTTGQRVNGTGKLEEYKICWSIGEG